MNLPKNKRKPGSGRPRGGTSFTNITMRELNLLFNEEDLIKVSRVWLEKKGLRRALSRCKELNEDTLGE
jgi:hypothetical protein